MNLGATIKSQRKQRRLTQGELASLAGISQTYLSLIETNEKEPTISTLTSICVALRLPVPILMFLALDEADVPTQKREAFKLLGPTLNLMVSEFFSIQT